MNLAVETRELTKYYEEFQAVDSVNLAVERGSLYGFLGPNGAGKSTTIKMLTGILAPSSGEISLLGRNPWDQSEAISIKKQTGVVPEDLALFDNLTAREYLTFVGRMHLMDKQTILTRSEELLNLLKLEGVETKLAVEYSHGMKKKLALAAALLPNPDLLFLDEPFEGVDAVTARVIRDLLAKYVARGSTVFVTSHVLEIVEKICTHVGIIANGKLVEQGSLDQLRQGISLEQRFLELVGTADDHAPNLSWLDGGRPVEPELGTASSDAQAAGNGQMPAYDGQTTHSQAAEVPDPSVNRGKLTGEALTGETTIAREADSEGVE